MKPNRLWCLFEGSFVVTFPSFHASEIYTFSCRNIKEHFRLNRHFSRLFNSSYIISKNVSLAVAALLFRNKRIPTLSTNETAHPGRVSLFIQPSMGVSDMLRSLTLNTLNTPLLLRFPHPRSPPALTSQSGLWFPAPPQS